MRRFSRAILRPCSSCSCCLQQHPELRGVRAETIRLIGTHVGLIDEEFRQNPRHHRLFMEILLRAGRRHA